MTAVKRIKYPSHYLENIWNEKKEKEKRNNHHIQLKTLMK